jgi:hypothetical protein
LVRPGTGVQWHRRGFRLFWRWRSKSGRPSADREIRDLIRQDERRQPALGCTSGPRRAAQTRYRDQSGDGREVHGTKARNTFSELADFPAQSCRRHRCHRHVRSGVRILFTTPAGVVSAQFYFFLAAFPVPESGTDCGEPVALSKTIRLPVSAVVSSTGLKVTDTLQVLPGLSVFLHCDLTAKTEGDALSDSMVTGNPVFLLPSFLMVTVLGLLVFPMVAFVPKFTEVGLIDTIPTGVGVAVGV